MRTLLTIIIALVSTMTAGAVDFDHYFTDRTLRLDYIFAGDTASQRIYLADKFVSPRWYGKRDRLAEVPRDGNGQIYVRDKATGELIYMNSFSTLFQEWLATPEAKHTARSFENVFLVPMPKGKIEVTVRLVDYHNRPIAQYSHDIDPTDILIKHIGEKHLTPCTTIQQADDTTRCIHIAYMAEGYTEAEMDSFMADIKTANDALFAHEPFKSMRGRFNIVAVKCPSEDSGTTEPKHGIWKKTALGSHFDTFYSDRYMTTLQLSRMHNLLAGLPYEHIIVLVNTANYGGGGIYNSYNLSFTKGPKFRPVVVHEFGHSFGGLGDEYPYSDGSDPMYFADVEPWEPNLTTNNNKPAKWQMLIDAGKAGLFEGGGYMDKGVWRPANDCRMRTNENPNFCDVCQDAIRQLIDFYTAPKK